MKTFCIKTNNTKIIDYLINELENLTIDNVYYCSKKFKIYKNVIIHYTGQYISIFEHTLADILTNCILAFYEENLINRLLNFNYFYFDSFEKKQIKNKCINSLYKNTDDFYYRKDTLWLCVYNYLMEYNKMILQGFVNFRIAGYLKILDYLTDICVNNYVIEKEYNEFIDLLKIYINSKSPSDKIIHLIYRKKDSILLDNNKNIIVKSKENFNAKFLSDISFSDNDYILNTLLNILPKKINIHLLTSSDDFINTLNLIFEDRIQICDDCTLCRAYKILEDTRSFKSSK